MTRLYRAWSNALGRFLGRWRDARHGGVLVTFAIATPVIAVLVCAAIDLAAVSADKGALQDIADSAALQGAKQLSLADVAGVKERTLAYVEAQITGRLTLLDHAVTITPDARVGTLRVDIAVSRMSFFANMLPPGGWKFNVTATGQQMGQTPLCVLTSGDKAGEKMLLQDGSVMSAAACMVHANADIAVTNFAKLNADVVQTAGTAEGAAGAINPAAQVGAPIITDPFADLDIPEKGLLCNPLDLLPGAGLMILSPGIHCGNITVGKGVTLTLLPGEHFFQKGKLDLRENAVLNGDNVLLTFGSSADFKFEDSAQIRLRGLRSGPFAGFVLMTTRANKGDFEISTDAARELLGTVYIPSATLRIAGSSRIADQSAWTVIVAKSLLMTGSPNLVINANYAGSSVPTPTGVGPGATSVRLAH
ncbi:Flp pilus assembly protein TadG [Caulobacter ginsengisoli]|uniref:Flp pilus assembly protein TadG n=1 Tax=Caulobacter ginsengisoli TaxID=400775 RepID=A0ABU0IY73_9CAUL|nr:pilus assembly protein [Caulobacter ginsengisoli]MDQ0466954.1 Flp pilus assembly protein TadG [Caulobacter ginsengisoli]